MAEKTEKILDIKVNYKDGIEAIAKYRTEIDKLKDAEKSYKEQLKKKEIGQEEYNKLMAKSKLEIQDRNEKIRVVTKQLQLQRKEEEAQLGSLEQLRAQLSQLTTEYDKMSEAQRTAAKGETLKKQINEMTAKVKGEEEATDRFFRSVGSYQKSLSPLFDQLNKRLEDQLAVYEELVKTQGEASKAAQEQKKAINETEEQINAFTQAAEGTNDEILGLISNGIGLDASFIKMFQQMGSLAAGAKMAGVAIAGLAKQLLALLANPVVAFLALVSAGIMAVVNGIKSSEENMNRWNVVMAPVTRSLDALAKIMQTFAGYILSAFEAGGKLLDWMNHMAEKLPFLGEKFKEVNRQNAEYIQLAKERAAIEKESRDLEVQNAKDALKVATLKAKADDELNISAKERLAAIREANRIEEEASKKKYELAKRNYEQMVRSNAMADNTVEVNREITRAEVEMYNALTEYQDKRGELLGREVSLANEIKQAEKEKADEAKAASEKALAIKQKELTEVRKAEDELLKLVKDGREKQTQEISLQYDRQIEDLRIRLKTETDLTVNARKAINQQIVSLEEQKKAELQKLSDEQLRLEIQQRQKVIATLLESVKEGSEQEFQLKIQSLIEQRNAELAEAELSREMRMAIEAKYDKQINDLYDQRDKELAEKQAESLRLRMENELMELQQNGASELEVLQEQANQKLELLNSIYQQEGESEEAFLNRKLQANQEYTDAKKALADKEVEIEQTKVNALATLSGQISQILELAGENNRDALVLAKTLAIAEVAINQGVSIANAVRSAAQGSKTVWDLVANIATAVTTVVTTIASATKSIKSAKFASGGLVTGPGTGTSDSIPAQLSNGESVMTAKATSMFSPILSYFNQAGGGVPINVSQTGNEALGEEMLARAFSKALVKMPSPVVSVEEINRVNKRVKALENLGNL